MGTITIRTITFDTLDVVTLSCETDLKLTATSDVLFLNVQIRKDDWLAYHSDNPTVTFQTYVSGLMKARYAELAARAMVLGPFIGVAVTV